MSTRMIFSDGTFVWPQYCDDRERIAIQDKLKNRQVKMYCGCRKDIQLEYKISADLRFVPAHIGYEHAVWCDRYDIYKRNSAYISSDYGEVRAYLGFDFKNFSYSNNDKEEKTATSERSDKDEATSSDETKSVTHAAPNNTLKGDKSPTMDLKNFVRALNHDAYMSRVKNNKYAYLSREYYRNVVIARTKKIRLNRTSKLLSELNINDDGVSFLYASLSGISDVTLKFTYNESEYSYFVPGELLQRAKKRFLAAYEVSIEECLDAGAEVIAAGFRYKRRNKKGTEYKVIGRLTLFMTNKYGLHTNSMHELALLDNIMDYCRQTGSLFLFPDNAGASCIGTISHNGFETAIYPSEYTGDAEYDRICALHNIIPSVKELSNVLT